MLAHNLGHLRFQGQYFSQKHLDLFFEKFVSSAPASDAEVRNIVGPNMNKTAGVEAELDIQYIMGVSPGIATDFYSRKGDDFCQDLVAWTDLLLQRNDDIPCEDAHRISTHPLSAPSLSLIHI